MVFAGLIIFTNTLLTVITGLAIPKLVKRSPKDLLESSMESESFLLFEEESSKQIEVSTEEVTFDFVEAIEASTEAIIVDESSTEMDVEILTTINPLSEGQITYTSVTTTTSTTSSTTTSATTKSSTTTTSTTTTPTTTTSTTTTP